MSTLGKRLDQVRQTKEMTLEEFGTYLGYGKGKTVARQVMSRMINDHRLPTLENLKKLQEDGVDLNWLVNGTGILTLKDGSNSGENDLKYHFYEGPNHVETIISQQMLFPEIINMQGKEIYTVRINSEMMYPSIKIGDTVNAVKVDSVIEDGLYVSINEIEGRPVLWIKRLFLSADRNTFQAVCDNPVYPEFNVEKKLINSNLLNLRVFSIMLTVDKIPL